MIRDFRVCEVTMETFGADWCEEEKLYKMRMNFKHVDSKESGSIVFKLKTRKEVEDMTNQLNFIQKKLFRSKIYATLITSLPVETEHLEIFGAGIYWIYYNREISRYILLDAPRELAISRYIESLNRYVESSSLGE